MNGQKCFGNFFLLLHLNLLLRREKINAPDNWLTSQIMKEIMDIIGEQMLKHATAMSKIKT